MKPNIHVRNSLYWSLESGDILAFDLDTKSLAVIKHPMDTQFTYMKSFQILPMEDGGLGLAILSGVGIQLWERKPCYADGVRWLLQKTIELNKILPRVAPSWINERQYSILGYDEDGHVILVSQSCQVFMIELKSMQFKNFFESNDFYICHPYRSFFTSGNSMSFHLGIPKYELMQISIFCIVAEVSER